MLKFLKGVVAGSAAGLNDLPYNIGEPYASAWGSWTQYHGTSKDDGSPVSIFSLSGSSANDGHLAAGCNGVKRLRTVRHPNILSFLHSTEAETFDGSTTNVTIYIVTEPVVPLSEKIKELGLESTQRDEYYAWGLHRIAKAVSFLNNDCKLVHRNDCLASVVVTQTLDWKLHAFDVLSEFDGNNETSLGPMLQYEWLVDSQYKSMELLKSDWATIRKSPPWAIDSWGLVDSYACVENYQGSYFPRRRCQALCNCSFFSHYEYPWFKAAGSAIKSEATETIGCGVAECSQSIYTKC